MYPALHYDLVQARQQDLMQSAAKHRLAAQAKAANAQTARRARRGETAAVPGRRVLQLISRLLPA